MQPISVYRGGEGVRGSDTYWQSGCLQEIQSSTSPMRVSAPYASVAMSVSSVPPRSQLLLSRSWCVHFCSTKLDLPCLVFLSRKKKMTPPPPIPGTHPTLYNIRVGSTITGSASPRIQRGDSGQAPWLMVPGSLPADIESLNVALRGSVGFKAGFETVWGEWMFSIYLILPAALGPGIYSASNRNEYQKQINNVSGE
jgi:hypothetical protein